MSTLFEKLTPYYALLPLTINFYFLFSYYQSYKIFLSESDYIDSNAGLLFRADTTDYESNFLTYVYLFVAVNSILLLVYVIRMKKWNDVSRHMFTIAGYVVTIFIFYLLSTNHSVLIARRYAAFELESANTLRERIGSSECAECVQCLQGVDLN